MKKILAGVLLVAMVISTSACSGGGETETKVGEQKGSIKVGLVLTTAGLGDKNFNDMTYAGLIKAQEDLGIEFDYVEPKSTSDFVPNFRMFAETEEYDLIIGLSADQGEAIAEVSLDFPDQKFSLIDDDLENPNTSSIYTRWEEQTFLAGVIAGLGTKSDLEKANDENVVGVVLGMDFPALKPGVVGFEAGARYVNPDCEVLTATVENFNDPGKAKEIALSMYNRGADFIQHIAGASGLGVFNAAKEADHYVFGVGGNQNDIEPDYIVATAIRNVDNMVYDEVKALVEGTWTEGVKISGLKEGAVGYSVEGSNVVLSEETIAIVEEIKEKIISGELVLCNTEEELEEWVASNQYE